MKYHEKKLMERDKPINISDQWPILLTWFTLIRPWISNYIHYKEWFEITFPFLNFNGATVEDKEWISNITR